MSLNKELFVFDIPEDIEELLSSLKDYIKDTQTIFSVIKPVLIQLLYSDHTLTDKERIAITLFIRRMQ